MKVIAKLDCDLSLVNRAASMTTGGSDVGASLQYWMKCEHSPLRMIRFWIECEDMETFVSVHFVRHGKFAEHFVKSNRDDRGGNNTEDRHTPVTHGIETNAQELINMAKTRLCRKSHKRTMAAMMDIKRAVSEVVPELADYMVPQCVYRNGICPEGKNHCKVGPMKMLERYSYYRNLFNY